MKPLSFKRHRFPADAIRLAVWLYFRFTLSLRDVEDLMAERGADVTYETVRCWVDSLAQRSLVNIRKLLKKQGFVPDKIVTNGLASYGAALRELGCSKRHEPGQLKHNNRAENSHLPVRRRERKSRCSNPKGRLSDPLP